MLEYFNLTTKQQLSPLLHHGRKEDLYHMPRHLPLSRYSSPKHYVHNSIYILPIEGANVILGIEWLCTLGFITTNFFIPNIAFNHLNQHITLKATKAIKKWRQYLLGTPFTIYTNQKSLKPFILNNLNTRTTKMDNYKGMTLR